MISGMFSVNDTYTSLRVQAKAGPAIITAFKKIRAHGLAVMRRIYEEKNKPEHIEIFIL